MIKWKKKSSVILQIVHHYLLVFIVVLAPHSSVLAWGIPWTEEAGGREFVGSQRVGHDWATDIPWGYILFGNTVMKFTVLTD